MNADDLTPRMRLFVAEYLKDLNATQAAIRAGYSERSAYQIGHMLLKRLDVRNAVERGLGRQEDRARVDADFVITAAKEVIARSLQRVPVMEFDRELGQYKQVTEKVPCDCNDPNCKGTRTIGLWEYDSNGVNGALKILAAHVRGFKAPTVSEVTGKDGVPLLPPSAMVGLSKLNEVALTELGKRLAAGGAA